MVMLVSLKLSAQQAEYNLDIRSQRMIAEGVKNNVSSRPILQQKAYSWGKTQEDRVAIIKSTEEKHRQILDKENSAEFRATLFKTFDESVTTISAFTKLVGTVVPIPWIKGISKAGEFYSPVKTLFKSGYLYEIIGKHFDPTNITAEANRQYVKEYDELLPVVSSKSTTQQKNEIVGGINNPYLKDKTIKAFNSGGGTVSSNITYEDAVKKMNEIDKTIAENNDALADTYAEILHTQQKSYITAKETQKEVAEIKSTIKTIKQDLRRTELKVDEVIAKQKELAEYTQRLGIAVDLGFKATATRLDNIDKKLINLSDPVLQAVLKDDVGIGDKIKLLQDIKSGKRENSLGLEGAKLDDYLDTKINGYQNQLDKLNIEKKLAIADRAIAFGQIGLAAMEKFGIGSEKDRKFVSNMITVATGVTAVVRAFNGDPSQLISFAMGSLSKNKPSPEMQMLQEINERLIALEETVVKGFESLSLQLVEVHKDLAERINFVNEQLFDIKSQIAFNHQETTLLLFDVSADLNILQAQNNVINQLQIKALLSDIYACEGPYGVFTGDIPSGNQVIKNYKLNTYAAEPQKINSFIQGQNCQPCLEGLLKFASINFPSSFKDAFNYQFSTSEIDLKVPKDALFLKPELYKNLLQLWERRFVTEKEKDIAAVAMQFPTINSSEHLQPYKLALESNLQILSGEDYDAIFKEQNYIYYQTAVDLANYFYEFYPMLQLYDQKEGKIYEDIESVRNSKDIILNRNDRLSFALSNIRIMIERAMAHESLIAGNMLFDTFVDILTSKNNSESKLIFKILRSSPIIAQNFASYLVSTTIKTNEVFDSNLRRFDNKGSYFVSLEDLIEVTTANFFHFKSTQQGLSIGIQKQYENFNADGTFNFENPLVTEYIDLPLIQELQTVDDEGAGVQTKEVYVIDRFIAGEGYFSLLEAREKIISLLSSKQITDNVKEVGSLGSYSTKEIDFLLYNDTEAPLLKTPIYNLKASNQACEGDTVILSTDNLQSNYKWYKDGVELNAASNTLTVTSSGNYQVKFSEFDTPNVSLQISDGIDITFNPKPIIENIAESVILTGTETFQQSNIVISGGTPDYTYKWSNIGSSVPINNTSVLNAVIGPFNNSTALELLVTDSKGCSVKKSTTFTYESCKITSSITGETIFCKGSAIELKSGVSLGNGGYIYEWFLNGSVVSSNANVELDKAGTLYVQVTDQKGCYSKSSAVQIEELKEVNAVITGQNEFCTGSNTELLVTSNLADAVYEWFLDEILIFGTSNTIEVSKSGNYTVKVTDVNMCSGISSNFAVKQKGVKAEISVDGPLEVYEPNTIRLNAPASTNAAYQWLLDGQIIGGAEANFFIAKQTGIYNVRISSEGCLSTSNELKVVIQKLLSSEPTWLQKSTVVFPNPNTGIVNFSIPANLTNAKISVYNANGELLRTFDSKSQKGQFEIDYKGLIFVNFSKKNLSVWKKIIVQ